MPDNQDPDSNQGDGSVGNKNVQQQRKHIESLEQQLADLKAESAAALTAAAEVGTLKEQLATFQKSAAFDRLNIPPNGTGKLFRDTYTGDLTDEAILAKAAEYGVVQPPATTPPPSIPGVDMDAWARQQAAFNGTTNNAEPNALDLINGAKTIEELDAVLSRFGVLGNAQ
jgi:hypothetical protein